MGEMKGRWRVGRRGGVRKGLRELSLFLLLLCSAPKIKF